MKIMRCLLVWLPFLLIDRVSRYAAMAMFKPWDGVWYLKGNLFVAFCNGANPRLFYGFALPGVDSYLTIIYLLFGLMGISLLLIASRWLDLNTDYLWALTPYILGVASNATDRWLWQAVSDPLAFAIVPNFDIAFNLADLYILAGLAVFFIVVWKQTK